MIAEASLAKKYSTASPSEGWISSVWGSVITVNWPARRNDGLTWSESTRNIALVFFLGIRGELVGSRSAGMWAYVLG